VLSFLSEARESLAVKRREFISLVGGAAACTLAARAQQRGKLPVIGFVGAAAPEYDNPFLRREKSARFCLAALEAGHAEIVARSGQRARRRRASYSQQAFLLLASTSMPRISVRSNAFA
jgi:hypothetical protein